MRKPDWAEKPPADMTDEEIKEAREVLHRQRSTLMDRLSRIEAAEAHLERHLQTRFNLPYTEAPLAPYPEFSDDDFDE